MNKRATETVGATLAESWDCTAEVRHGEMIGLVDRDLALVKHGFYKGAAAMLAMLSDAVDPGDPTNGERQVSALVDRVYAEIETYLGSLPRETRGDA